MKTGNDDIVDTIARIIDPKPFERRDEGIRGGLRGFNDQLRIRKTELWARRIVAELLRLGVIHGHRDAA